MPIQLRGLLRDIEQLLQETGQAAVRKEDAESR